MNSTTTVAQPGAWARFFDSDIWYSFRTSPIEMPIVIDAITLASPMISEMRVP